MVTLTVDDETYAALHRQATARGLSIEAWLKLQSRGEGVAPPPQLRVGEQMAKLFGEIGLRDDETFPELKDRTLGRHRT